AIGNVPFASCQLAVTVCKINKAEANTAAARYGIVRGLGHSTAPLVIGVFNIFTFPFPVWRDSYRPVLPSDIPYIHAGYSEFPPELGNESKYPYCRDY